MTQHEKAQKKIQELQQAKSSLSDLITKIKTNMALSDEELALIEGGLMPGDSTSGPGSGETNFLCVPPTGGGRS